MEPLFNVLQFKVWRSNPLICEETLNWGFTIFVQLSILGIFKRLRKKYYERMLYVEITSVCNLISAAIPFSFMNSDVGVIQTLCNECQFCENWLIDGCSLCKDIN